MAGIAPTIQIQPKKNSLESTLEPILFQFAVTPVGDTLNVISQLQYNFNGVWTDWGGKMRSPSVLGYSGSYQLQVADVLNSLPKGTAKGIAQLGNGACYGGAMGALPQTYWHNKSNFEVRLVCQREFLDATTGFIEIDPTTETSNVFNIHEGSAPRLQALWSSSYNDFTRSFANYIMMTFPTDGTQGGWLWLTDNVYKKRSDQYTRSGLYRTNIRDSEQFFINTFIGKVISPLTYVPECQIITFAKNGTPLFQRSVAWATGFGSSPLNGMNTMDVGFRSIKEAFTPDPSEGTNFAYVDHYLVQNRLRNANNNGYINSNAWLFKINRTCKGKGYQRFLWKNQLGGWDMFSSEGKLETRRKIQRKKFTQRLEGFATIDSYGQNHWLNTESEIMKIESHPMTNADAIWFSKIGASTLVYLRIDMNSEFNPQSFGDFNSYENWRDSGLCNQYTAIIILSGSIKVMNTSKGLQKVSFEYQFANNNIFPRM